MGMFGLDFAQESAINSGLGFEYTAEDDAMMEAFDAIECFEEPEFAFGRLALENATNFHNLTMAIAIDEMNTLIATKEEVVYEESKFSSIMDKVKKAIQSAWQKAKGVFEKIMNIISGWVQNDKKFVETHKKAVNKFKGTVTVKGYNFTHLEEDIEAGASEAFDKSLKAVNLDTVADPEKALLDATKGDMGGFGDKMRANCVPGFSGKSLEAGKFTKELNKYFRNGEEEAKEIKFTAANGEKLLNEVSSCKTAKASAKASYEGVKKYFKFLIAAADKIEAQANNAVKNKRDASHADKVSKAVGKWTSCCNQAINIAHVMMNAHIANINAAHNQAKKVVVAMANGGDKEEKKEKVGESALESVVFI